ncbi:recombinase RecD [Desulfonema ishimotonii]|uniref:Recombinase RecD n=1 Tax=Desulfonema ishimotonii TaxID=45657 RepID=A0A401G033_9BACT|nr:ATP-dependent RecD-like DNA helicase [Desulfonema ishimotonii]GBC62570.1 recombinase RecD [Desulfonema ishimotonii]
MLVDLQGQIERITYTNEESGYTIARLKVPGQRDLVTIVGNLMAPMPGEIIRMKGEWTRHPRYGDQFKVVYYNTAVPATVYGIRKYLGSGLIKGVGPVIAERIVRKFGEKTLDIIEADIGNLTQVDGIGEKRIAMIRKAWDDQKEIREVMLFLQSHGVSSGYATKIFKRYGNRSVQVVRENPYRLATDIFGIGFLTADRIAENLGFEKNSPLRAEAGILYVLNQLADEGHVYYPYEPLMEKCREILGVERAVLADAFAGVEKDRKIRIEDMNEDMEAFAVNNKAVYLTQFHVCEVGIARRLKILTAVPKSLPDTDSEKAIAWVQDRLAIGLAEKQKAAIKCAIEQKVMVITGGPGTGKTTIINAILKIFAAAQAEILLAAPTGRAAKRMSEATGFPAKTIHRLLRFSPATGGFEKNYENPLECGVLILDEASMIDTVLMHHLLKAVPAAATLILVGDVNQLPSVGAGNVLNDIIASGAVPVVTLSEIFRQARESRIIVNAHRINQGRMPHADAASPGNDFYFIQKEAPEAVLDIILRLVKERIPRRFGFDPVDDIQVLSPMHRGIVGAGNLNMALQNALNPGTGGVVRGQRTYRVNDKVMQIRNNYDKAVFNGDIGRITRIDAESREVLITFDGRALTYDYGDLDEVVLAYAVSVHKSQGSEYPAVVMPVLIQHYMLLQRNLIYTGMTRGRELVVLVGTKKALAIGVHNDKTQKRFTCLRHRLA